MKTVVRDERTVGSNPTGGANWSAFGYKKARSISVSETKVRTKTDTTRDYLTIPFMR